MHLYHWPKWRDCLRQFFALCPVLPRYSLQRGDGVPKNLASRVQKEEAECFLVTVTTVAGHAMDVIENEITATGETITAANENDEAVETAWGWSWGFH